MDNNDQTVVVSGVRGTEKEPFTRRFKDEAAYEKWRNSDASQGYQVDSVMNESAVTMKYYNVYETVDGSKIPFAHKIYSDDKTAISEGQRIVAESGYRNFAVYENEEIDQLDEISPETLGSYTDKAKKDLDWKKNLWDRTSKQAKKRNRDIKNREKGMKTAVDKLTREETLDEISKKTLGSYIKKASDEREKKAAGKEKANSPETPEDYYQKLGSKLTRKQVANRYNRKFKNRRQGIDKATDKLTREETILDAITPGNMKLGDGSTGKLTREDDSANKEKIYAVRTSGNGYVIFGPYDTAKEAFADAGPSLEATLRSHEVSRKLRQKLEKFDNVTITSDNYKRMVKEGYKELPPIDAERYDAIPGMEGPFRTLSGHVVYYDPKAGEYYDRNKDMYIDRDEFRSMDTDYSGMKDESDIPVGEGERHGNSKIYDRCWDGYRKVPGKKRGEKGSCVKEGNEFISARDAAIAAGKKTFVFGGRTYKVTDKDPKDVKRAKKRYNESMSRQRDMDPDQPIVARGVKGMNSKPFRKKFRNMAAYNKWSDSDAADDYEIQQLMNEGLADFAQHADRDHEVQMARSDLYKLAEYSIKLHNMLKNVSEMEGIQGWQQAKITKAADYISSVYHSLKYDQHTEITEGDVVNFSSFAGMYSDGASATFTGRDGKTHKLTATGDTPRRYFIDGKEVSWDEVKRVVGKQQIRPRQGMTNETTTAGGMAVASKPLGKMQKRKMEGSSKKVDEAAPKPGSLRHLKHHINRALHYNHKSGQTHNEDTAEKYKKIANKHLNVIYDNYTHGHLPPKEEFFNYDHLDSDEFAQYIHPDGDGYDPSDDWN